MRKLGAMITAAIIAATMPNAASASIAERVTITGFGAYQSINLRFANYGTNVAGTLTLLNLGSISSYGGTFTDVGALNDWNITANSFDISSTGQITAATFEAVSTDGLKTVSFNMNGVNRVTGPGTAGSYDYSDNLGLAGLAFKFVSGSLVSGPSNGFLPTAAVPESATWVMMIGGFGLVGGAMRRRRRGATLAAA